MKNLFKNFVLILLIFLIISGLFAFFAEPLSKEREISFTQLVGDINAEKVKEITVSGSALHILYSDDAKAKSRKETEVSFSESLLNYGVEQEKIKKIEVKTQEEGGILFWLGPIFIYILPLLLFGLFFFFIFRQAKAGAMQAFSFTKARARLFGAEGHPKEKITFNDVAGLKEAKEELKEVVDFLKNPKKYLQIGAKIPRGVLLVGPAGCGKTMLARAVAGQANVPFFHTSGSSFVELFVGVGASVASDTPILIKTESTTKLMPISEFVDQFYPEEKKDYAVPVSGIKTLGYQPLETKCWGASQNATTKFFGNSRWTEIKGVYRHKVNEIYEIYYLGGKIKTTGDHSVFVRSRNFIKPKKVSEIKPGDILVNLPFKTRSIFIPSRGTTHKIKAQEFPLEITEMELSVWDENRQLEKFKEVYEFALSCRFLTSQKEIASQIGVSQSTVGLWQREVNRPRYFDIAARYEEKGIPRKVRITPSLMKLLGYYTAEGRRQDYSLQFVFGAREKTLHEDCTNLMQEVFNVKPHLEYTEDNALRITYFAKFLGDFFEKHCGNGSRNKHIPEFLWDLPRQYFLAYLEGYSQGDGYTATDGKLKISSTSRQLILELAWLCSMHGIKAGVGKAKYKGGRIIKNRPLPEGNYWTLIIGKTSHPFIKYHSSPSGFRKPKIIKIVKKSYNGYVYDLCGCENEAFFGGEKPILLHNSRVRDLFSTTKKHSPSILFIDELDAIGRHRGAGLGGGHDEREQTLNQILVEMDGFERDTQVIIIAATNRPDILDPALLRPGRFDRKVVLDLPDVNDREDVLKIHSRGKPLSQGVNLKEVAERTPGFSGADLANVVNEAAILAARRNKTQIGQTEFLESIEKVLLGPERKSHILSKKEKEIAAYHEAGHALVSASLNLSEPVRKISIISRGLAAGYTLKMPTEDRKMKTKAEFLAELATLLGGYCAEELVFKEITTGASNDLEKTSDLARRLVKEYGMSPLGPISFGEKEELVFLGREIGEQRNYSEKVAAQIDKEVAKIILNAQKQAAEILKKKRKLLDKIAKALIEKETIEREEFEEIIGAAQGKKSNTRVVLAKPQPRAIRVTSKSI